MVADGSFDSVFARRFGKLLRNLNLRQRVVIELGNPYLPAWVPLKRKELWFDPAWLPKRISTMIFRHPHAIIAARPLDLEIGVAAPTCRITRQQPARIGTSRSRTVLR
jgi:hypothetical protein